MTPPVRFRLGTVRCCSHYNGSNLGLTRIHLGGVAKYAALTPIHPSIRLSHHHQFFFSYFPDKREKRAGSTNAMQTTPLPGSGQRGSLSDQINGCSPPHMLISHEPNVLKLNGHCRSGLSRLSLFAGAGDTILIMIKP